MSDSNEDLRALVATAAAAKPAPVAKVETAPLLTLRIGTRWFAVAAERVREVVTLQAITQVPGVAAGVLGVSLVHGRLVPVADLVSVLQIARGGDAAITRPRLIVLSHGDNEVGIVSDETRGIIQMPPVADPSTGIVRGELRWDDNLVAVLDADAVLAIIGAR